MEFISYENPAEFKSGEKRRGIRSYVTKRQHRLRREADLRALDNKETRNDDAEPASEEATPSISEQMTRLDEQVSSQTTDQLPRRKRSTRNNTKALISTSPRLPPRVPYEVMLPCDSAFNTLASYIHATMVPTHVVALGLDASESHVASQWFSTSSNVEPALYTSALLTATPMFKQVSPDLVLYLKSATITSLVHALANDARRQDPALILAVECLTFYEFLHGDRDIAQRVHRPAMRRLIQAYGGRDGVEIPISWKKVSLMADIIMEMQMGSEGESSFLDEERHENSGILDAEWTEALRIYLPDVKEGISRGGLPRTSDRTTDDYR